jgi:lipopolysaccharide biosynthesis glycosyltransferase
VIQLLECTPAERRVKMKTKGVIYFNVGTKCLPRLVVSLWSLRKVYGGSICLISMGDESNEWCRKIAEYFGAEVGAHSLTDTSQYKQSAFLEKARMHHYSPYDNTIFIDSDTLIKRDFSELFEEIEEHHFIVPQFSNWTTQKGLIKKRLRAYSEFCQETIEECIKRNGPSVNVGVYGFSKDSTLMWHEWFVVTIKIPDAVLPEESTAHFLTLKHRSKIISSAYNCSCKFDNPYSSETKIIHYHGKKHCRPDGNGGYLYSGELWMREWQEVLEHNICGISDWFEQMGDKKLNKVTIRR